MTVSPLEQRDAMDVLKDVVLFKLQRLGTIALLWRPVRTAPLRPRGSDKIPSPCPHSEPLYGKS